MTLHPCPSCARHVAPAASCPFCNASLANSPEHVVPKQRLGRAARFAFGAALVSVACGGPTDPGDGGATDGSTADQQSKDASGGSDATSDATMNQDTGTDAGDMDVDRPDNFLPPYGAPPPDGLKKFV
jgi:hypothetical protein